MSESYEAARAKEAYLNSLAVLIIYFENGAVFPAIEGVLEKIQA
jgi:hypothetical protein